MAADPKTTEATGLLNEDDDGGKGKRGKSLYAEDKPGPANSMSFVVAASFCINYVMGSGFLGLPAVFQEAGLVLSPIVLVFFMWLSDGTKDLLLEAMARVEALTRLGERNDAKAKARADLRRWARREEAPPPEVVSEANSPVRWRRRDFTVAHHRTFQLNELMLTLWGRTAQVLYMVGISLYLTGAMWGYASVFSASFAANVPLPFLDAPGTKSAVCDVELDWVACASHYHLFLLVFACCAIPLACMEFREQAAVQVTMTVARIVVLFLLVGTVLGGLGCDGVSFTEAPESPEARSKQTTLASGLGLLRLLPVCLFAFIFHHSAPGVAEPVKDKRALPGIYSVGFVVTGTGYLILATLTAFFFGDSVKGQASLSWEGYVGCMPLGMPAEDALRDRPWLPAAVGTFILVFPALDVLSAFPLNAVTLANSLATAVLPPAEIVEIQEAEAASAAAAASAKAAAKGRSWGGCLRSALCWPCVRSTAAARRGRGGSYASMPTSDGDADAAALAAPAGADGPGPAEADAPVGTPRAPMVCWGRVRRGTAVKLSFRVLAAGVPVAGAAFVSDLSTILSWTGVVGVFIGLTVPALLQIAARRRCMSALEDLERDRAGRAGAEASPLPQEATPMLEGTGGGVGGASPAGLELEAPALAGGPSPGSGGASLNPGSAVRDGAEAEGAEAGAPATEVEDDDLVMVLRRLRAGRGREAEAAAAAAEGRSGALATPSERQRALRTPFDHRALSSGPAAWGVVVLSGVMVVVVVTGLLLFGG